MLRKHFVVAGAVAPLIAALPAEALASETDFDLVTPTGTLFGTLAVPPGRQPMPVVLVIAGSGPTDRNGNAPGLALNMYAKLATALAALGIASVRFDKRGVAASHAAGPAEADLRFETYVGDVEAWVAKLRGDDRFSRLTIAGHSEGSLLGMLASARTPVDAYVSVEGAGFPANVVLARQLAAQLAPYPDLKAQADRITASLSRGTLVPEADVPPPLLALFRPSVQPYLISWFAYDPRVAIGKATGHVTIVQGTNDAQVSLDDGKALAAARPAARFVTIDGMTHVLVDDSATTLAGQRNGAYADAARPLDERLVRTIARAATGSP